MAPCKLHIMGKHIPTNDNFEASVTNALDGLKSFQRLEISGVSDALKLYFTYTIRRHLDGGFVVKLIRCSQDGIALDNFHGLVSFGECPEKAVNFFTAELIQSVILSNYTD
jgi:hypothetical protein